MPATSVDLERRFGARNYHPLDVVLERGEGVWLFDTAGRRYLDMMSAYSAVSFGHSNPRLVAVLVEQTQSLLDALGANIAELRRLHAIFPSSAPGLCSSQKGITLARWTGSRPPAG